MCELGIYLGLDEFFDTRFTVLFDMSPQLASECLADMSYQNRVCDTFGWVKDRLFMKFYEKRNRQHLQYASPTGVQYVIDEFITANSGNPDMLGPIKLYMNTYPYNLDLSEIDNIGKSLGEMFPLSDVVMINMATSSITPSFVNDKLTIMFMYHGLRWLNELGGMGLLFKTPMVTTKLYVPKLMASTHNGCDIETEIKHISANARTVINLEAIDTAYFLAHELIKIENTLD